MSNFYTNVQLVKDKIYYIGYEDGRRVKERFDYSPTLYLTSQDAVSYTHLTLPTKASV